MSMELSTEHGFKPLLMDASGQTQQSRSFKQLAMDYFSVEERDLKSWFEYVYQISRDISFFDIPSDIQTAETDGTVGHWQSGMPNHDEMIGLQNLVEGQAVSDNIRALASRPDIALLLSFFHLLSFTGQQYRHFTERHKRFYLNDVLGFKPLSAVPDKAHIIVGLGSDKPFKTLLKGTQFSGGADASGKELIYESTANAVLSHANVAKLITLSNKSEVPSFAKDSEQALLRTYAIDLDNGLDMPESGILTFGENSLQDAERQISPQVGLTLVSQLLYLSGGDRTIKVSLNIKEAGHWYTGKSGESLSLLDFFTLWISTIDGMVSLDGHVSETLTLGERVELTIQLDEYFPAIETFVDEANVLLPSLPSLSLILKEDKQGYLPEFGSALFSSIKLHVSVKGLGGIRAANDSGIVDTTKPFEPFTFTPALSSRFNFTHPELLAKPVSLVEAECDWLDRPNDFDEYYRYYAEYRTLHYQETEQPSGSDPINMATPYGPVCDGGTDCEQECADKTNCTKYIWPVGKVNLYHSNKPQIIATTSMFSDNEPVNNIDKAIIEIASEDNTATDKTLNLADIDFSTSDPRKSERYFSLVLTDNDFGHKDYAAVSQYFAIKNIGAKDPVIVPNPYTPKLNQILINYESETTLDINVNNTSEQHQLNHIDPVGRPDVSDVHSRFISLVPQFKKWGYLYIGMDNVVTPGQFRLYFQLDPVDGGNASNEAELEWSYLDKTGWKAFSRSQGGRLDSRARIVEDSTYNLLDSGVMGFELPDLDLNTNFLGDKLFWIRVQIEDREADTSSTKIPKYSRIRCVKAQGVEVVLSSVDHDPSHYEQPLPAGSISSLVTTVNEIGDITQLYPSFAAKGVETASDMEVRAAERMRHKNRAITYWDYERLVLAEFPELYMARCYRNMKEERVEVVVVPVNHDPSILQPKVPLYLKRRIERFISTVSPMAVDAVAVDPVYEEVTFDVTLKISNDYDLDSTVSELNKLLIEYMTPWNKTDRSGAIMNSKTVYLTEVASALERHPAVEVIFVLRAYTENEVFKNEISPSSNAVILVPVSDHKINLLNKKIEVFEGIGKWVIEDDFEIA